MEVGCCSFVVIIIAVRGINTVPIGTGYELRNNKNSSETSMISLSLPYYDGGQKTGFHSPKVVYAI